MDLPRVLIVEDDHFYQTKWLRDLAGRAAVLRAYDQETARKLFQEHPDIRLIVMDGYVPFDSAQGKLEESTTVNLVKELRQKFTGPILAVSSSINKSLKEHGCNEVCEDKDNVAERVLALL